MEGALTTEAALAAAGAPGAEPFRLRVGEDAESLQRRIAAWRAAREAALAAAKREAEFAELAQCTFAPATTAAAPPVPQPTGPVVVRGLGRHLELRELAVRLAEEAQAREAEVFGVHAGGPKEGPTVPVPFRLATEARERAAKVEARKARQHAAAARELTFAPATHSAHEARVVAGVLAADT
jgi:hypothetical protein